MTTATTTTTTTTVQEALYEVSGYTATITLNRPRRGNAFTPTMMAQFVQHVDAAEADPAVRVVVLTGKGRYFCTGMDLGGGSSSSKNKSQQKKPSVAAVAGAFINLCNRVQTSPLPFIAVLNGPAIGGGVGLMFLTDLRLALSSAYFQFTEVRRGILPAMISTYIVPQLGPATSKELFLTGRICASTEAQALHVFTEVAADGASLAALTDKYVTLLGKAAPRALAEVKSLVEYVSSHDHQENVTYAVQAFSKAMRSPEARHGMQAFREKRTPDWTEFGLTSRL